MRMSPEYPPALVPATAWLTMVSPPIVMSVQFGPRLPFALAKLSEGFPLVPPAVVVVVDGTVVVVVPPAVVVVEDGVVVVVDGAVVVVVVDGAVVVVVVPPPTASPPAQLPAVGVP